MLPDSIDFKSWYSLTIGPSKIDFSDFLGVLLEILPWLANSRHSVFLCLIELLYSFPLNPFDNLDPTLHTLRHVIYTMKMLLLKFLHQHCYLLLKLPHLGIEKLEFMILSVYLFHNDYIKLHSNHFKGENLRINSPVMKPVMEQTVINSLFFFPSRTYKYA